MFDVVQHLLGGERMTRIEARNRGRRVARNHARKLQRQVVEPTHAQEDAEGGHVAMGLGQFVVQPRDQRRRRAPITGADLIEHAPLGWSRSAHEPLNAEQQEGQGTSGPKHQRFLL